MVEDFRSKDDELAGENSCFDSERECFIEFRSTMVLVKARNRVTLIGFVTIVNTVNLAINPVQQF